MRQRFCQRPAYYDVQVRVVEEVDMSDELAVTSDVDIRGSGDDRRFVRLNVLVGAGVNHYCAMWRNRAGTPL